MSFSLYFWNLYIYCSWVLIKKFLSLLFKQTFICEWLLPYFIDFIKFKFGWIYKFLLSLSGCVKIFQSIFYFFRFLLLMMTHKTKLINGSVDLDGFYRTTCWSRFRFMDGFLCEIIFFFFKKNFVWQVVIVLSWGMVRLPLG